MRIRRRALARSRAARTSSRVRIVVLSVAALLWCTAILVRLVQLQLLQHAELAQRAERQQQRSFEVTPKRGVLYDRHRRELAVSIAVESVFAVPSEVAEPGPVAAQLAAALKTDPREAENRLRSPRSFVWIQRKVDARTAQRLRDLNLPGIYLQREHKRFYPKRELAAHVLGFVGVDENGLAGIEYSLDSIIRGPAQRVRITADGRRHSFERQALSSDGEPRRRVSLEGASVVLTLDENIQYIAERQLAAAMDRTQAASGTIIVQDPHTGEILALANAPTFNPNDPISVPPSRHRNQAISLVYEPGSTFKVVTVAAALEEQLTRPAEIIDCQNGGIVLAGHLIRDHKPFGLLSVREVISESSDVGAIKLGLRLGNEKMYEHIRRWRFGETSGIELPAESRGLLRPVTSWSRISLGAISMGQEVALTSLQLSAAVSAIGNGGVWVQPHVVREILRGERSEVFTQSVEDRILSSEVAEELRRMLTLVVTDGTGRLAQPAGYSAAGKTGTAQKIDQSGTYSRTEFVASFSGFAPAPNPRITVTVVLDTPRGRLYHGGEVAAPVFRAVVEQALAYLNVPYDRSPREPRSAVRLERASVQDFQPGQLDPTVLSPSAGINGNPESAPAGFQAAGRRQVRPSWWGQTAPEGGEASAAEKGPRTGLRVASVVLSRGELVELPDFAGRSLREVVAECARLGLEPTVAGSGVVVRQQPAPASRLPRGSRVWVELGTAPPSTPVRPL